MIVKENKIANCISP